MIVKVFTSRLLVTPVLYNVSLSAVPVRKHFDNNFKKARDSVTLFASRFSVEEK